MMAPPEPSETNWGYSCLLAAVHTATPSDVHCTRPDAFTRCAYTSATLVLPWRLSCHVTMAPPAPSATARGDIWSCWALQINTSVNHCCAPVDEMRCA